MSKESDLKPFQSRGLSGDQNLVPSSENEVVILEDKSEGSSPDEVVAIDDDGRSKDKMVIREKNISDEGSASEPKKSIETLFRPVSDQWEVRHIVADDSSYDLKTIDLILDYLNKLDLLTEDQIQSVHNHMNTLGSKLIEAIVEQKFLKDNEVGTAVAPFFNCTYIPFKGLSVAPDVISILPKNVSEKAGIIVFDSNDELVKLAMVNPRDTHMIHLIEKKTGKKVKVHYTTPYQITEALKSYPSEFASQFQNLMARATENISHLDSLSNISQVFDSLVLMAYQQDASDVHIEPLEDKIRVRFRVDGVLFPVATLPSDFLETIINHIKVLAKLRIDAHNAAQDGRFHVTYDEITINFRVSIMPSHYGEKVVLRLLTSETQEWSLSELGYSASDQAMVEKALSKTNGMILCCGPTGSGKTTTLYAILKQLNQEGINISTIEDPIEYGLSGIVQTQVNPLTNITYAEGLKSLMRQDPDILMIGEIRDFETGKITVNSALTGHLVLSTLHTNNASLAPLRLLQMSIDPYLIVNTVHLIIAQRLVRKICKHCLVSYSISRQDLHKFREQFGLDTAQIELFESHFSESSVDEVRLFKGQGCSKCGNTGFHGRIVIAEILKMQDSIRKLILENKSESEIEAAARLNGMTTMFEDGLNKIKEGVTTLEEVFRVVNQ